MQAYAAARMTESVLLGLNGEPNIYECAFVQSEVSQQAEVKSEPVMKRTKSESDELKVSPVASVRDDGMGLALTRIYICSALVMPRVLTVIPWTCSGCTRRPLLRK
jgi:hypothetical protein